MSFVTILKQADIFYELSNTQLELVASICTDKVYQAGELVFEENSRHVNGLSYGMQFLWDRHIFRGDKRHLASQWCLSKV